MSGRLRGIRLTRPQIALIAVSSALATGLIVRAGTSAQSLPYSTVAAMKQRVAVHTIASHTPVSSPGSAPAAAQPATASAAPPVSDVTPAPISTSTESATAPATSTAPATVAPTAPAPASAVASAKHVFVIALTTTSYRAAFGPRSVAHYLNLRLRPRGVLLSGYHTLGGSELPDYLAMVSGQAPNADTRSDCTTYAEFGAQAKPLASGQVTGRGCVYPNTVLTIADQVTAAGKQWKAFLADMGTSSCMHPDSNAADGGPLPGTGAEYDTRHNPFVYFHSLLDLGSCSSDDVGLQALSRDLRAAKRTPSYSFIAPGACDEPGAVACPGGESDGLAAEDAFLKRWVPAITSSPAYGQGGVLMIVFARAPSTGGSGPVRAGALVLSTKVKAGATVPTAYNPYSVLRSAEDLLGYTPLVHAKSAKSFASIAAP